MATGIPKAKWPRNLTLALGTADVSPVQMAQAYAVFANGGRAVRPWWLREVDGRDGTVLIKGEAPTGPGAFVFTSSTCATMVAVMKGVLGPEGSAYSPARANRIQHPGRRQNRHDERIPRRVVCRGDAGFGVGRVDWPRRRHADAAGQGRRRDLRAGAHEFSQRLLLVSPNAGFLGQKVLLGLGRSTHVIVRNCGYNNGDEKLRGHRRRFGDFRQLFGR